MVESMDKQTAEWLVDLMAILMVARSVEKMELILVELKVWM
jgi:hypothetical protein